MKTAGVRELRARFSAYLREVERGEVVLVTDHGRVAAELRLPGVADLAACPDELRYRRLVEAGRLVPGQAREVERWLPAFERSGTSTRESTSPTRTDDALEEFAHRPGPTPVPRPAPRR